MGEDEVAAKADDGEDDGDEADLESVSDAFS